MSAVVERAQARADALRREAAELLGEALPGLTIVLEGETIRLTGRSVARRWLAVRADHLLRSLRP